MGLNIYTSSKTYVFFSICLCNTQLSRLSACAIKLYAKISIIMTNEKKQRMISTSEIFTLLCQSFCFLISCAFLRLTATRSPEQASSLDRIQRNTSYLLRILIVCLLDYYVLKNHE